MQITSIMSASGGQCFRQEDLSCTFLLPIYVQSRKAAFSIQPYWTSMTFYSATFRKERRRGHYFTEKSRWNEPVSPFLFQTHTPFSHYLSAMKRNLPNSRYPPVASFLNRQKAFTFVNIIPYVCGTQSSISHLQLCSGDENRSEHSLVTAFPALLSSSPPRKIW